MFNKKGHETEECNWSRATAQNHKDDNENKEELISDGMDIPEEPNNPSGKIELEMYTSSCSRNLSTKL